MGEKDILIMLVSMDKTSIEWTNSTRWYHKLFRIYPKVKRYMLCNDGIWLDIEGTVRNVKWGLNEKLTLAYNEAIRQKSI